MRAKTIKKALDEGKFVIYRIRRLRGYLWGHASIIFAPNGAKDGEQGYVLHDELNIQHKLDCFRFDEKPYDKPIWKVCDNWQEVKTYLGI